VLPPTRSIYGMSSLITKLASPAKLHSVPSDVSDSLKGVFSMTMVPANVHWAWFFAVLAVLSVITAFCASYAGILRLLRGLRQ
jgi:hypothetical protein